ncbi:MAG TPA: RNA polymerase sigma factor [Candidatus Bathyarchaeia archaeon]|nr:RNA polymerase sigma factor [Candidatus Bathyarchaeia archaeon]
MVEELKMESGDSKASAAGGKLSWPQTPDGFRHLVEGHLRGLLAYAAHRLRDIHDAEDVVQDVFVRAYAERAKHRDVIEVTAYLYRMTSNACADLMRKRRGRSAMLRLLPRSDDPPYEGGPASPERGPSQATSDAEQTQHVEQLLGRLPKAQAETVRLRVFGGLTLGEIALLNGCSIHTVSSRLRYGFRKLRRLAKKDRTT